MAALTVRSILDAGTKPASQNSSASDSVDIGDGHNTFLRYVNTGGSDVVVTINVPGNTDYGQPNPDPAITVVATTGEVWIPIHKEYDDGNGANTATVTVASGSGVTLQVTAIRTAW